MGRGRTLLAAAAGVAVAILGAWWGLRGEGLPPAPPTVPAPAKPPAARRGRTHVRPRRTVPARESPGEPGGRPAEARPPGANPPEVIGTFGTLDLDDPGLWVALESAEDPTRPDPSLVEDREPWGFRITGFPPGRYRVRVESDDSVAAYSDVFEAVAGKVVDVGRIELTRAGQVRGTVLDVAGQPARAEVRLLGRDPASLGPAVVEEDESDAEGAFSLRAHEPGAYRLVALGDEGYATASGHALPDGSASVDLRLQPWARLRVRTAAGEVPWVEGAAECRLTPLGNDDASGFGPWWKPETATRDFERLRGGRYLLEVLAPDRSIAGGGRLVHLERRLVHREEVSLSPDEDRVVTVPAVPAAGAAR